MVARRPCLASPSLLCLISLEGRVIDLLLRLFYILLGGPCCSQAFDMWMDFGFSWIFFFGFSDFGKEEAEGMGKASKASPLVTLVFLVLSWERDNGQVFV